MKLNDYFRKFLGNISLNPTREERIINALSNWNRKFSEASDLESIFISFFPQGSYSTGTTIKPKESDEYDIDAVLLLNLKESEEPKDILYQIRDQITSHKEFEKKAEVKDRCVRINYAGDFHVDIVPALPYGEIIKIPSNKEQAWSETNPAGFTEWCNTIDKESDRYYSDIVKMTKHWRDNKVGEDTAPKSILLATIIGHNFKKMPSLAETLIKTLEEIIDFLDNLTASQNIVINNPSLLQENIARDWDINKANRFLTKVKKFHDDAVSALDDKDKEASIEKWQNIFGTTFFPSTLGEGKEMANQIQDGTVKVNPTGHLTREEGTKIKSHRFYGNSNG